MNTLLFIVVAFVLPFLSGLFFGTTTSAGANEGGYTSIPQQFVISIHVKFFSKHSPVYVSCSSLR